MIDLKEKTEGFRGLRSGISEVTIIDFGVRVKNDRKIAEWVIGLSRNQRSYNPEMGGRNAPKYALASFYFSGAFNYMVCFRLYMTNTTRRSRNIFSRSLIPIIK